MAVTGAMPQMGESVVEGTLEHWLVKKGDWVDKDQNLCEITTDKVDAELPAPVAGVVSELLVDEGVTVAVGAPLIVIEEGARAEQASTAAAAPVKEPAQEPERAEAKASPVARRMAEELGIDLATVQGSGVSGRVMKADVQPTEAPRPATPAAQRPATDAPAPGTLGEFLNRMRVPTYAIREGDRVVPFSTVRKRIAEHMVVSKIVSPHVGTVAEVDLHKLVQLREGIKRDFKRDHGFSLTYLPFAVQATVRALREFPRMNSTVVGENIVEHSEVHVGVAVETERGLLVPVVRNADRLSLVGIAEAIQQLASRARTRDITADELAGGTFTVSNPGRQGNLYGFAVINQPQVGIIRTGEVKKTPVVVQRDGEDVIAIHPVMHVALSYDHRVIDGVTGNGFLYSVAQHLSAGEFEL